MIKKNNTNKIHEPARGIDCDSKKPPEEGTKMDDKEVKLVPYAPSEEVRQAVKGLCENIKETLLLPSDTWGQGKSVNFYLKFQVVPESITVKIKQD